MSRIAVIVGHARKDTFCEALGEAYRRGTEAGGHHVKLFVTSKTVFDPILHEGFTKVQPLEPDLRAAHDVLMEADHLVLVFPLWLGTLPAILRDFWSACCSLTSWSLPGRESLQKSSKASRPAS